MAGAHLEIDEKWMGFDDRNYLFTGDVTRSNMKKIAKNADYPLHKEFYYIKIPHQGTRNL